MTLPTGKLLVRRWAAWIDGFGMVGRMKEYSPPALEATTEDFQAGDMDMPVPVETGMAAMSASVSIFGVDPTSLALFGLQTKKKATLTVRTTLLDDNGKEHEMAEVLTGMVTKIEQDSRDTGSQMDKSQKMTFKLSH